MSNRNTSTSEHDQPGPNLNYRATDSHGEIRPYIWTTEDLHYVSGTYKYRHY